MRHFGPEAGTREREAEGESQAVREKLAALEPLSWPEAREALAATTAAEWPDEEALRTKVSGLAEAAVARVAADRDKIAAAGLDPARVAEEYERFRKFDKFRVAGLETSPHWPRLREYFDRAGIKEAGRLKVIVVDDPEFWQTFHGGNPTKSSLEDMTIWAKPEIFDRPDASAGDVSWLVHEAGHLKSYALLGPEARRYQEAVEKSGRYAATSVESVAYQAQLDYLKDQGQSREQCAEFLRRYLADNYGPDARLDPDRRAEKDKEMAQLSRYLEAVFDGR